VFSSVNSLQNAEHMTAPAETSGLPEPEQTVRLHGAVNLVGGIAHFLKNVSLLGGLLTVIAAERGTRENRRRRQFTQ
jgi:hypothetical protein